MMKPQPWQVVPRLFWPGLFLCLLFGLSAWSYPFFLPERFTEHWFRNATALKCVHSLALGQLGLVFLCVTIQALPVLFHLPHAWKALSAWGVSLWIFGVLMLVSFFAGWRNLPALVSAVSCLGLGWALLYRQALVLSSFSAAKTFAWDGLGPAFLSLGMMILLGTGMGLGLLRPLLPQDPLVTLRLHIHLGLWGFGAMAIFGFMPKLLRLFQASTGYPDWPLKACLATAQLGLLALLLNWLGLGDKLPAVAGALFFAASLLFTLQIAMLMRAARAPRLDSGLAMQLAGILCLIFASGLDLKLLWREGDWRAQAATLALGLGGFVSFAMLGTLQRVCAVLAWFQRFYEKAKTLQVPTAWDLGSPWLAWASLPLLGAGVGLLSWGLLRGDAGLIQWGGASGCLAQLAAMGIAVRALTRGEALPFPGGLNPFEAWVNEQEAPLNKNR